MSRISKRFTFSSAHALSGLPPEHQCSRIHGHNYIVEVFLESHQLVEPGFVRDYGELKPFKEYLDTHLDHRWLGYGEIRQSKQTCFDLEHPLWQEELTKPVFDFNPTAELMARHLYTIALTMFQEVTAVGVSETPNTWAWYSPLAVTLESLESALETLPDDDARQRFLQAFNA
jgi:6-pyruvoyltetrahydropterin/6-carboxytetrahydropterin synthase